MEMKIASYTVKELHDILPPGTNEEFIRRINSYGFTISTILCWDITNDSNDYNKEVVGEWILENRANFEGKIIWSHACQVEFEKMEDALTFKLRWTG